MVQKLQQGDKVRFDSERVNEFVLETTNVNSEIDQYQKLVLAGIHQQGIIKEFGITMSTVTFDDGWDLPIPTKYLIRVSVPVVRNEKN